MYAAKVSSNGPICNQILQKSATLSFSHFHKDLHKMKETHYEILGLKDSCSQNDIKAAFINLSKELHPDKLPNGVDSKAYHAKFVQLNDAYTTLSKPNSRALYDATLKGKLNKGFNTGGNPLQETIIFRDKTIWEHRDRSEDAEYTGRHYYGVSWTNGKVPNSYVLSGVLAFMVLGMILQYSLARLWTSFTQEQIEKRNNSIAMSYKAIRERALNTTARQDHLQKLMGESEKRTDSNSIVSLSVEGPE